MKEPKKFYDQFGQKLLSDFAYGNKRMEEAIAFVLHWLPAEVKNVLDVGCGIGWSTSEVARWYPHAEVVGVDLSDQLLEVARLLFSESNLEFFNRDVTRESLPGEHLAEVVLLIDVFEHIPIADRPFFQNGIRDILAPGGRVILTCPSAYHQDYLRTHHREGLQPVDEDVDAAVIQEFAQRLGGEVLFFSYQNIWRPADYLHAVISGKNNESTARPFVPSSNPIRRAESKWKRQRRIAKSEVDFQLPVGLKSRIGRLLFP
ncbi:MAG: class I SAM-dependent methyltransferase [Saprospiraceae bacterium]|nr:class I SAM-dependent methyltransferase [Saprospiraceae bacterium]MCB0623876.1 class I SAM-dependent methyltransferase [Saprospiraceae bacterium]MCB0681123.1 class I SAM-dependent methyltransferase [Saprospiraceae bacterium]